VADDPDGTKALALWLDVKDDLLAGRTPRAKTGEITIRDLLNRFVTVKRQLADSGELSPRTFGEYYASCQNLGKALGLRRALSDLGAEDFERLRADLAKKRGVVTLGNEITRVRVVFNYAYQAGMIDRPIRFGAAFKRPSKKTLRLARASKGSRMFDAESLRRLLRSSTMPLQAMLLLGVNCGFGNADCAGLPIRALDLDGGWVNYPRPKTGVSRRCPLWPETVLALQQALAKRPKARVPENDALVFLTRCGKPWGSAILEESEETGGKPKVRIDDPLAKECAKLVRGQGIWRPGLGFYALRHTFQTIGDGARDPVATRAIMGHAEAGNDMSAVYREGVDDARLKAVADHVRRWLFGQDVGAEAVDLNKLEVKEQAAKSTPLETPPAQRTKKPRRRKAK
jgi:integrase